VNEDMLAEGTWDLGEVLAERAQPVDTVTIYLDELASFTKAGLMKAKPKGEKDILAWQIAMDEVDAILEEKKYVIHLTAIPSRMREDIHTKAMVEKPIRPTGLFGQDEPENAVARQKIENNLIWHAQITNVVNPRGLSRKNWTLEEIAAFSDSLPTAVQTAVDEAIKGLTVAAEEFTVKSKNADF